MKQYKILDKDNNSIPNVKYIGADTVEADVIPTSNFKDNSLSKITGYTVNKPFKLLIFGEVSKFINGKKERKRIKRALEFPAKTTMKKAIESAKAQYAEVAEYEKGVLSNSFKYTLETLDPSIMPTFKIAFDDYLEKKITRYESENRKMPMKNVDGVLTNFGNEIQFAEKWLKPLYNIPLDQIKRSNLEAIMAKMKNKDGTSLDLVKWNIVKRL